MTNKTRQGKKRRWEEKELAAMGKRHRANRADPESAIQDVDFRRAWAAQHPWCMACGSPERPGIEWQLQTHHILGGKHGRSDEACNFLRVHQRCHELCHDIVIRTPTGPLPTLSLAQQLTLKKQHDPETWNRRRLKQLRHPWTLPNPEPLPAYFCERWEQSQEARRALGWMEPVRSLQMATIRMHPDLYRRLAQKAASLGQSMNVYCVEMLSSALTPSVPASYDPRAHEQFRGPKEGQ